ncbi:MAG: MotA/TolQ/ExbB proton channel family protein [Planctomycetaceae bacterium]|nr:MotA/TolQ/ExbB proton channel family protein [Planctomycetaceae bacterium]
MTRTETEFSEQIPQRPHYLSGWWKSPILWGALSYVLFYALIPVFPFQQELLARYCTSHPLEYVTLGLFFLGMSTLIIRWLELYTEDRAVDQVHDTLDSVSDVALPGTSGVLEALQESWRNTARSIQDSIAGRRLHEAVVYVSQRPSGEKLEEHLRYFSDLEHDLTQRRLGFVNTISWAVPILGFLGTVMGITMAIANVTPDQLDQSLPEVTGGLAVAFDTTALSLTLSLGLVFATYLVRSRQDDILNRVDQQLGKRLCFLLQADHEQSFLAQHSAVAENLTEVSEQIVLQATDLWKNRLNELQDRMVQSIEVEHHHFVETLHAAVDETLQAQQTHLSKLRAEEQNLSVDLGAKLEAAIEHWTQTLDGVGTGIVGQTQELQKHSSLIVSMIDKQQELTLLQQKLHESLDASEITETLDQTLNSLTAAIQLLNVRVNHSGRAA